jgi:hypothetical protein
LFSFYQQKNFAKRPSRGKGFPSLSFSSQIDEIAVFPLP